MGLSCLDPVGYYPMMREARRPLLKLHPKNTTFADSQKQVDPQSPVEGNKTIRGTYLDWVCLVRFFMVKPSFPMIAPTNCVGTSIRSGKSSCLGCEEPPGEEPCSLEEWPPRRDRWGGGGELTSSSGM